MRRLLSAVDLLVVAAGFGWLAGGAATGQRYPGLSFAWALPALAGFVCAIALVAIPGVLARRGGLEAPARYARWAAAPLWLSWAVLATLWVSSLVNHYFANWPRIREAALLCVAAAGCLGVWTAALLVAEARWQALSRLAHRAGIAGLIFAGTLAIYVVVAGGHLYSVDEWTIYAVAAGIAHHGYPAAYADEPYPLHLVGVMRGSQPEPTGPPVSVAGRAFTKFGVLPSLLAAPLVAIAERTGPGPELPLTFTSYTDVNRAQPLVPMLFNPLITAATAALLYTTAIHLGYGRRAALFAALALAFCSLAFVYGKTLFNMSLASLLLLASFWLVVRPPRATATCNVQRAKWSREGAAGRDGGLPLPTLPALALAGVAAGLGMAARYEIALLAWPVALLAGWRGGGAWGNWRRAAVAVALFWLGCTAAAAPLVLGMNLLRTGRALDFGYGGEGTLASLAAKPWYGLLGMTLSPGCGLVMHTPLMALGLFALIWLWDDRRAVALTAGGVGLLALAYYGTQQTTYCANFTWGPRYLIVVGPFLALPLAALWKRLAWGGANPFAWLWIGGLAVWSLFTNLLAVLIDFNRGWQDHYALGVDVMAATWLPYHSLITSHFRLLRQWIMDGTGGVDLYLLYARPPWTPLLMGALLLAGWAALTAAWAAHTAED